MKKLVLCTLLLFVTAGTAWAAKTTYVATNHRFNYVKLKEVSGSIVEARGMTHPATLDETGLRAALASINLSRSHVIKKEIDSQRVFDDRAIDFLAPNLVRAFSQATPDEVVVFSYLSKDPLFIIRNDHLNICEAWVHGDELHIKFEKFYAKITGDVDKRGNEARAIARARGLRVKLELGDGQKMGVDDPDEIILDMHHNYAKKPEPEKPAEGVTMSGERIPTTEEVKAPEMAQTKADNKKEKTSKKKEEVTAEPVAPQPSEKPNPKVRLEQLDQLKKDGLINKREYEEKRKEILKEL